MQDSENDAEEKRSLKSTVEYEKEIEALTKRNKALEKKLEKAEKLITPDKKKLDKLLKRKILKALWL